MITFLHWPSHSRAALSLLSVYWIGLCGLSAQDKPDEPIRYQASNKDLAYESISDALQEPEQVLSLDLSAQNLNAVPQEISQFKNLHYLNLSGNQLQEISPEIGQLSKLHYLDLSENQLSELPSFLAALPNLQWINLAGNANSQDQLALQSQHLPTIKGVLYQYLENNAQASVESFYQQGLSLLEQKDFKAAEKAEYLNLGSTIYFWLNNYHKSRELAQKVLAFGEGNNNDWKSFVPRSTLMKAKMHMNILEGIQSKNNSYEQQASQLELKIKNLQVLLEQIKTQRDREKKMHLKAVALARDTKQEKQAEESKRIIAENMLQDKTKQMRRTSSAYRRYLIWGGIFALAIIAYIVYRHRQTEQEMDQVLSKQKGESAHQYRSYLNATLQLKRVETELKIKEDEIEVLREIIDNRTENEDKPPEGKTD